MVLIYISLMTNDVQYFFMCLLIISIYFFLKFCSDLLPIYFLVGLFVFLLLNWWSCLCILGTTLCQILFFHISSQPVACMFIFLIVYFDGKISILMKSNLLIIFMVIDFCVLRNLCLPSIMKLFSYVFL